MLSIDELYDHFAKTIN